MTGEQIIEFLKHGRRYVAGMCNIADRECRPETCRHRNMLRVVLGETLEQKRFFEQALAGDTNLLGTRSDAVGVRVGRVMSHRWIE